MSTVPIGAGHEDDPFYRYRRSTVQIVYEKKNGCTTCVKNMDTILQQLKGNKTIFQSYLSREVGARVNDDWKFIGKKLPAEVEKSINNFIEEHLLCPRKKCRLPEWDSEKKRCKACGYSKSSKTVAAIVPLQPYIDVVEDLQSCSALDAEMNKVMHRLYDYRDTCMHDTPNYKKVNRLLDKCWMTNTEARWQELRQSIDIFLS